MFTNPVISNCSDGSTSDAVFDILVIPLRSIIFIVVIIVWKLHFCNRSISDSADMRRLDRHAAQVIRIMNISIVVIVDVDTVVVVVVVLG